MEQETILHPVHRHLSWRFMAGCLWRNIFTINLRIKQAGTCVGIRDADIYFDDSFILENLFSGERIQECDETVFLEDEEGEVLALAIISKTSPCVWSYYTIPKHRGKGCGYRLLVRCLERILEVMPDPETQIIIEPTSDGSEKHIAMLPDSLRARLMVRKC